MREFEICEGSQPTLVVIYARKLWVSDTADGLMVVLEAVPTERPPFKPLGD